jgi:DNA-binding PadR family transcriptional regulator
MVLGLLMEGERHGYELVREMEERGMLRWTRASKVAVYKALARLEEDGCLTSWTEKLGGAPEKRVYAITAEGEERLRDLVHSLCSSQEPLRFEISVGLAFIQYLDQEETKDALERRLRYVQGQLKHLGREREIMEGLADDLSLEILRHELAAYREEARWLTRIIDKMAHLQQMWAIGGR